MSQTNRIFIQSATKMIRVKVIAKIVVAVVLLNAADCVRGSRILAIFPTASYSHQIVLNEFAKQLHRRGHELVVVTPNPNMNEVSENYTEIDISFIYKHMVELNFIEIRRNQDSSSFFDLLWDILSDSVVEIYEAPEFRRLYAPESGEKFDLVIVEALVHQGLFSLAHRFDAPLIGITSLGPAVPFHYVMGNPIMTSHPSIWELAHRVGTNVSLWRKIWNFVEIWKYYYTHQTKHLVRQNAVSKKYVGEGTPDIWDIQNKMSLILCNQDPVISYGRPNVPGIIPFGGFHISKKLEPLQKDLKDFLDGAENGFIYMSLGTNAKSKFLPNQTKEMFLQIFSKLPQRVLWKFESDLHGKSDNIFISNWLPQQTVLSHPNIKLFIYQGGLQSTEEAIHHKVPLLGIPVLADQDSQVNRMVDHGVAKRLEILTLEKVEVEEAICELITDKRYKENMVKLNALVNDKPYDPLQNAIWWTEFVIRHKGAPHLRSTTANEFWYERFDMDVIVILTLTLFIAFVTLSLVLIKLTILTFRLYSKLFISSKQKIL